MGLILHAQTELRAAGFYDKDSDYEGTLGEAVEELITVFAKQGHSGFSAHQTLEIFKRLANFKPLSDLTDAPSEWMDVSEMSGCITYQNRRQYSCFSNDGGKTYYDINERQVWWRRWMPRRAPFRWRLKHHQSKTI